MTNFSHPQCYARSLRNCSKKISREHYVSASVLELLGDVHVVSQASWLSSGQRSAPLPVNALGSKVLCEHHNNVLSELDSCAGTFFAEIVQAFLERSQQTPHRQITVLGDDLERWVLKAFCGVVASGNLIENKFPTLRELPQEWLAILFSGASWQAGAGLHIRQTSISTYRGCSIGPVYVDQKCVGGGFEFAGIELFVLLDSGTEKQILEQSTNQISHLIYRPGAIEIESPFLRTKIGLQWQTWNPITSVLYSRQ